MGRDIHLLTQIKKDKEWNIDEKFLHFPDIWDCRCYSIYDLLNENFGGYGIPDELKNQKLGYNKIDDYYYMDATNEDLYGWSYVTLKQLKQYHQSLNKVIVSEEFLELFFQLGGKLPPGMSLSDNGNDIIIDICDEDDMYTQESLEIAISQLSKIAKENNVTDENIRVVFCFDC